MVLPDLKPVATKHLRHTHKALGTLKQAGDVRGWFGLVQKGRPKSIKNPIALNDLIDLNVVHNQPDYKNVLRGFILYDAKGDGACQAQT